MAKTVPGPGIRRRFADVSFGQVHYYTAGEHRQDRLPVCLLHASPWSARWLAPVVETLGRDRRVIAPDHPGQGDSSPAPQAEPDMAWLAGAFIELLDALDIERCDLFGMHTGSHIATEVAVRNPGRVRRLALEGVGVPDQELKDEYVAHIRGTPQPDEYGSHFQWIFHMNRDLFLFFPYYRRDAAHRRDRDLPGAAELHVRAVEILKNLHSYRQAYIAAWQDNPGGERFRLITAPTLLTCISEETAEGDMEDVAALIPDCEIRPCPPGPPGDLGPLAGLLAEFFGTGDDKP